MDKEIDRIIAELAKHEPTSIIYRELLYTLQVATLARDGLTLGQRSGSLFHPIDPTDTPTPKPAKKKAKKEEPVIEFTPVVEPTPVAEPVPTPVVEEPAKTVADSYSKEEVRAALSEMSGKGIQIKPIIEKYVPEGKPIKFAEIPASSYLALMEELYNAR